MSAHPDLKRLADLLEEAAREARKLAGTSETSLDPLDEPEAECRRPECESTKDDQHMPTTTNEKVTLLLTTQQFAEMLNIRVRTLRRWRADPRMKLPKPLGKGRVLRWRRSDAIAWVEGSKK